MWNRHLGNEVANGKTKRCRACDMLYVQEVSYNLLSVSKAVETGNTTKFTESSCQILDDNKKSIDVIAGVGSLYYLECCNNHKQFNTVEKQSQKRQQGASLSLMFGNLRAQNLNKFAKDKLVDGFDYDESGEIRFVSHARRESTSKSIHNLTLQTI